MRKKPDARKIAGDVPTQYRALVDALPAEERKAAALAIERHGDAAADTIKSILTAQRRTESRRRSDRQTDARRRVLVGARVPRSFALSCKAAANARGVSLYAWTVSALKTALCAAQWTDDDDDCYLLR